MKADRWKQIDKLLDAALEASPPDRERFLRESCGDDEELRREVWSLLEAGAEADGFLENSAMNLMAKQLAAEKPNGQSDSFAKREIGTYRIERMLGAGGMGEVYLAFDRKLDRPVALKILPAEFLTDAERLKRFAREARAISALNHPNIVTIYDVGTIDNVNFIATEFVEGKTVRELVGGNLKLKEILSIAVQTAEALAAAHGANVVHRDIKPENVMLRPDGYVKVLDFGLAKLAEPIETNANSAFSRTGAGVVMGTLAYMSPEQATGETVDARSDIWSLGVVIYEMATGRTPFKSENRQATFNRILSSEANPVSESNPHLPPELDRILSRALEKDPDLRYQTAPDLRAELKRLKREIDSGAVQSASKSFTLKKSERKFSWKIPALAASLLILSVSIGAAFWWRNRVQPAEPSPWNNALTTKLTDFPGAELDPNLSPDGKTLLYSRAAGGNEPDIFRQRVGGSNPQNLTADSPDKDAQPAFSPDGEQIAFRSDRDGGGIFVMGATGEAVKRLTDFGFNPAWSPDGKEIVFSTVEFYEPSARNNEGSLWIVTVATGARRRLETGSDAVQPQFSPGGKRIAFWGRNDFRTDLWTVDRAGGVAVRVNNDKFLDWNPVWSPDGKYLYFCSNRSGSAGMWRIRIDENTGNALADAEAVVGGLPQSYLLTISRDGKNLVYANRQSTFNIQKIEFDSVKLQIVGKPAFVTEGTTRIYSPDVSPDGKFVVAYVYDGQQDLILVRTDNLKRNLLTDDPTADRVPRFSPDGSRVAFHSSLSGTPEVYTIRADGSDRRRITYYNKDAKVRFAFWSPDGSRIAYSLVDKGLHIVEADKPWAEQTPFAAPPLNEKGDYFTGWSWSPDGKRIAGWGGNALDSDYPGIYLYDVAANSYEKIFDIGYRAIWLADNRHLISTHDEKLYLLDSKTKSEREILSLLPASAEAPAVSRDNRQIFYVLSKVESDIQMLSLK